MEKQKVQNVVDPYIGSTKSFKSSTIDPENVSDFKNLWMSLLLEFIMLENFLQTPSQQGYHCQNFFLLLRMKSETIPHMLTFDDVLLLPQFSEILPREAQTNTFFTPQIPLGIPIVSAAMDTVTEANMSIALSHFWEELERFIKSFSARSSGRSGESKTF